MTFSRKKNALIVTALSLLLVLMCLCPAFATKQANADDIPASQRQVYYYSDTGNLDSAITSQMQSIGIPLSNYHNELVRNDTALFMENFIDYADSGEYIGIQNAYIIFEIGRHLQNFNVQKVVDLTQRLESMFRFFKTRNCKIMFICNTDEILLYGGTDENIAPNMGCAKFLTYVDIHVNLDLLTWLVLGAVYQIDFAENYTFFFDQHYTLFRDYLLQYLRYKFNIVDENGDCITDRQQLINELYINGYVYIYTEVNTSTYKLLAENLLFTDNQLLENPPLTGLNIAWSSTTQLQTPFSSYFYEEMIDFRIQTGNLFFYTYNPSNTYIEEMAPYHDIEFSLSYTPANFYTYTLPNIVKSYLNNKSLVQYDNWYGNAAINVKPISMSENGVIPAEYVESLYTDWIEWLSIPNMAFNLTDNPLEE